MDAIERQKFIVYGSEIERCSDGSIILSRKSKLREIFAFKLVDGETINRSGNEIAMPNELKLYLSLVGKVLFVGRMTQPIMLRMTSRMATKVNHPQLHHLQDLRA